MRARILIEIETRLDALSPSERRVASWVRDNPARGAQASIAEVAAAAGVSEPTVIRFCRSLGLAGFRELKASLIAALQEPESYLHRDVTVDDAPAAAASKVLESSIRALVELRAQLSAMPFDAALAAMSRARELIFVGVGASGHVARDARHKFFRLGIPCSAALDPQTMLQRAAIAQPADVFLAVSLTGGWPEPVRAMKLARARRATVVALTNPHSGLASAADLVFGCLPAEDTSVFTPMSSRLAQLTLLDALQVGLALRMGTVAVENLRLSKEALKPQRDAEP